MLQRLRDRYRTQSAFRWAVDLSAVLIIVLAVGAFQTRNHPRGAAPAYTFTTLEQQSVALSSFAGKPTLIAVWAPWCGVCKAESGNVSRVHSWLGSRANVVSVATGFNDVSEVRQYMTAQGVDYPVLLAQDDFQRVMHVEAFPTVFVLDSQGRIVSSMQGYTTTLGMIWRVLWAGLSS
ncbi:MAG: TlpA disulfide reductase family protein [Archangium sp.]|nr:TlpA disulfide reductase family protein [Archangium sp.]MDP3569629.1 TlpA disulfide reductase family protein [Archangium sp.]